MANNKAPAAKANFSNDPEMKNLMEGKMSWADVIEKYDPEAFKPKANNANASKANKANNRALPSWVPADKYFQDRLAQLLEWETHDSYTGSGWEVPNLKLRKAIWENFPVVLTPVHDGNGTDRYAITWHVRHLAEWRDSTDHALSLDEHQDYEGFSEYKLLYSLSQHPRQYLIEPPRSDDQIAIIAMVHGGPRNGNNTRRNARANNRHNARANNRRNTHATRRNRAHNVPVLKSLNDIKAFFPVVWHEVPGKAGTKTYALEFHRKNLMQMAQSTGQSIKAITDKLMEALEASMFWNVLPAGDAMSICRLEMIVRK